jgi:isocitrate dehydrogenase
MVYQKVKVPGRGDKISVNPDASLDVPDQPIIPFIEGDGIGIDITPVMRHVVDSAVDKAYGGRRAVAWTGARYGCLTRPSTRCANTRWVSRDR